jgi:hypothetical protein
MAPNLFDPNKEPVIGKGDYEDQGSGRSKKVVLWILGVVAIAVIVGLVFDLIAGAGFGQS